jgi:hypothetical protein
MKIFDFFRKYMGKMVGAGAEIFDKLEPEPEPKFLTSWSRTGPNKNGPAPQHWSRPGGKENKVKICGTNLTSAGNVSGRSPASTRNRNIETVRF